MVMTCGKLAKILAILRKFIICIGKLAPLIPLLLPNLLVHSDIIKVLRPSLIKKKKTGGICDGLRLCFSYFSQQSNIFVITIGNLFCYLFHRCLFVFWQIKHSRHYCYRDKGRIKQTKKELI